MGEKLKSRATENSTAISKEMSLNYINISFLWVPEQNTILNF